MRNKGWHSLLSWSLVAAWMMVRPAFAPVDSAAARADAPELPPILVPPLDDSSATPYSPPASPSSPAPHSTVPVAPFTTRRPAPATTIPERVQKVTPLDVESVPLPDSRSTIPGSPPSSPGPVPDGGSTIPLSPVPLTSPSTVPYGSGAGPMCVAPAGFGLHVVIGEDFANPFVYQQRTDQGPIQDCILGARIQGSQTTDTQTRINFLPSDQMGLAQLELTGNTRNQTRATTSQAAIDTAGDSRFLVSKAIEFNGEVVATRSPAAFLNISQQTVGAQTQFTGVPLLGPLASAYARSQAEQRRPEAERIAAYKITEQVVPQFNTLVDAELVKLNEGISGVRPRLQKANLVPIAIQARSSEQALTVSVRMNQLEQSTGPPPCLERGLSIAVHETLVEGVLAQARLGGLEIPDTHLARLGSQIGRLLGKPVEDPTAPGEPMVTLILAKQDPIMLRFKEGRIQLQITTAIQAMKGPRLSERIITIPLEVTIGADSIRIQPVHVHVKATDPSADAVANELIRDGVIHQFKPINVPRTFSVPLSGGRTLPVSVASVDAEGGWLIVRLESQGANPGPAGSNGPTPTPAPYSPAPNSGVPGSSTIPSPGQSGPLLVPQPDPAQSMQPLPRFGARQYNPRYRYRAVGR